MLDQAAARKVGGESPEGRLLGLGACTEIREGWFFRYGTGNIGSHGLIVNKRTGRVFVVGSAFSIERDLMMYDLGYQFEEYDLKVLAIRDLKTTRQAIGQLPLVLGEPYRGQGGAESYPKRMTDLERWRRLETLPCTFSAIRLYFCLELIEEFRRESWFEFELREHRRERLES